MNGKVDYLFDDGWVEDAKPLPLCGQLASCRYEVHHGGLLGFYVEGVPPYLNPYPFEIGEDSAPLTDSADEQLRFAMSVVSNHSERRQIAALCARQARHIARDLLREYGDTLPVEV